MKEIEIIAETIMIASDPKNNNLLLLNFLGIVGLYTCIIRIFYSLKRLFILAGVQK